MPPKKKKKAKVPAKKAGFGGGFGAGAGGGGGASDGASERTTVEAKLYQDVVATATGVLYTSLKVLSSEEDAPSLARAEGELAATVEFRASYRARNAGPLVSKKKRGSSSSRLAELSLLFPRCPLPTEAGRGLLDRTLHETSRFVRASPLAPWRYLDAL